MSPKAPRHPKVKIFFAISLSLLSIITLFTPSVGATPVSDDYILGYATAVIARDFPQPHTKVVVHNGIIYVKGLSLSDPDQEKLRQTLLKANGVKKVVFLERNERFPTLKGKKQSPKAPSSELLPSEFLFKPLLADPRWPHFSASYQRYIQNQQFKDVFSANFGESFNVFRFDGPQDSLMEFGIQAGIFSIFNLDTQSFDLVNADYFVAIPLSIQKGHFSQLIRIYHQSSHLGDEYLLSGQAPTRLNLSYEGLDTIFSYDLPLGFRPYIGGGYLFIRDPSDLKPGLAQGGLEFKSPSVFLGRALRPVAGVDIQSREENDWEIDVSARVGVQFENPDFKSRKLMFLLEYYHGKSPNGQFFNQSIEYFGIGLHFFFE
jgi:Protein of unknown function (DUF1207)